VEIRRAALSDLPTLAVIARSAKASWGYPAELLASWQEQFVLTAQQLLDWQVYLVHEGDSILGFFALAVKGQRATLEHLWVRPQAMGRQIGRALLIDALARARASGAREVLIDSDPHAEGFYLKLGGQRIGETAAPIASDPARSLPRLRFAVEG